MVKTGGSVNESVSCWCREDFVAYADECFREFGDRVSHWTSVNELNIFSAGGYALGITPPKRCSSSFCSRGNSSTEPYLATHHMLLAHAYTARLYKSKYHVISAAFFNLFQRNLWMLTQSNCDAVPTWVHRTFCLRFWVCTSNQLNQGCKCHSKSQRLLSGLVSWRPNHTTVALYFRILLCDFIFMFFQDYWSIDTWRISIHNEENCRFKTSGVHESRVRIGEGFVWLHRCDPLL